MGKAKTSKKQKKSETKYLRVYDPLSGPELKNRKLVLEILLDCIDEDDIDTFREVLVAHLVVMSKTEAAKKTGLGRRTIYDLLDPKKKFNPELSTVFAVLRSIAA